MKKAKIFAGLLVLLLVAVLAIGCGTKTATETQNTTETKTAEPGKLDKVTLQLKWLPQSQFMGYYVAKEKGYFKEEGLDVEILPGGSDIIPEQQVANGVANIGVTWVSSLLKYQAQGWELAEVSQTFQKSAMLLVSKNTAGIKTPADLKGKKVGSWFGGNEYEIYALLEANKLNKDKDLKLVQQDFTMNQLLKGEIDAASAMIYNEFGLLMESGLKKEELNVIDMNDAGVAMMEDALFVDKKWLAENEDVLVRFLRASNKGWADAAADPVAAGKIVYDTDKSVSLEHQTYMAKEIAKLVAPAGFDTAKIGQIDMPKIQQTADLALKYGLLTKPAVISDDTFTNKYWEKATKK